MPRRSNIRTTVDSDAKSGHLNCLDIDQHHTRESNLQRKAREDTIFENSADVRPVSKFKFPSLGGGLNFNRGLNLISGPEMTELHQRLREERNFYWGREKTKIGWRKKKRFKKPLQQLKERLKGYFSDELLRQIESFDEIVWDLVAQDTLKARKRLAELAEDVEIPLTPDEREYAQINLKTWDEMEREEDERLRE